MITIGRASRPEAKGHDPWAAIAELARLEPIMLGEVEPAPERRFHLLGKWCLSSDFLKRLFGAKGSRRTWRQFQAISSLSVLSVVALFPGRRVLSSPSRAAAVVLKTNVRAIYPERGLTAKFPNPSRPDTRDAVLREAEIRAKLKTTDRISVPILLASGGGDSVFILEDFVVGAVRCRRSTPLAGWASALFSFYEANGLETPRLSELYDWPAELAAFAAHCHEFAVEVPERLMRFYRGEGLAEGRALFGLCHGDLTPSNLMFKDGRMLVLDWEHGRRDILLSDIARLASEDHRFCAAFLGEAEGWRGARPRGLLRPRAQLLIGCLVAVNRRFDRFRSLGSAASRKAIARRYRHKLQAIVDLAERYLPAATREPLFETQFSPQASVVASTSSSERESLSHNSSI